MTRTQLKDILDSMAEKSASLLKAGEIPVSCALILSSGEVILTGNEVEKRQDPLAHAEILALEEGFRKSQSRYLKDSILIVSLEPCLMCMGAILKAGVSELYYVLDDPSYGALSKHHVFADSSLKVNQIQDSRFAPLMKDCFEKLRK
jgi:tRNA(adenine34) deaminase